MEIPDLSHLTKEEQEQILAVIKRQQDEEEKEKAMTRTLKAQFENYKQEIKNASENAAFEAKQSPDAARDVGQVCGLCCKTKISEGCGHTCSYCNVRFCSRCGGKVPVISNKVMWVCNLCRKQQELLTKTGAWHRENRSTITLNLEPINGDAKKLSGSASMAQLENRDDQSLNTAPRLKKGHSEPQLAQCEKSPSESANHVPKTNAVISPFPQTATRAQHDNLPDPHPKHNDTDSNRGQYETPTSDGYSGITRGVRRSSTHSEKRLHRQVQAVGQTDLISKKADGQLPSNTAKQANPQRQSPSQAPLSEENISNKSAVSTLPNSSKPKKELFESSDYSSKPKSTVEKGLSERTAESKHEFSSKYMQSRFETKPTASNTTTVTSISERSARHTPSQTNLHSKSNSSRSTPHEHLFSDHSEIDGHFESTPRSSSTQRLSYKPEHVKDTGRSRIHERFSPQYHMDVYSNRHLNRFSKQAPSRKIPNSYNTYDHTLSHSNVYPNACRQCRERRGYSSDNEGSLIHNSYPSSPSTYHKNNLRHPESVLAFDDVDSCPCCQAKNTKFTSRRCEHGIQSKSSGAFPHSSNEHINCNSVPPTTTNVYHSDVDLSGPRRHLYLSSDTIHSCGYPSRKDHMRRRNYSPRRGPEYIHSAPHRKFKNKHLQRKPSLSSTDDEIQSTPDCSSCDEMDKRFDSGFEAESKDPHLLYVSSPFRGDLTEDSVFPLPTFEPRAKLKQRRIATAARPTTVAQKEEKSLSQPPESVKEKSALLHNGLVTKRDSGIETGSSANTVQSDDIKKDKQSVSWEHSADGRYLIGRMTLHKRATTSIGDPSVGVQISGGKLDEHGIPRAYVVRVKKGSVAERVGHLQPGDEVIEWNGHRFRGASVDAVYEAILATKDENAISLVACRMINDAPRISERRLQHPVTESSSSSFDSQKREDEWAAGQKKAYSQQFVDGPPRSSQLLANKTLPGKLQVRISFDQDSEQLLVTIMQADELQPRGGGYLNPYVKMYLLPDRSVDSKRLTKIARRTVNPVWNQTVSYWNVRRQDLDSMSLELTVWDMDKSQASQAHFLGEVLIDLGLANIDNVPQWFRLMQAGAGMNRISDSGMKSRSSGTSALRRVPSSVPVLHNSSRVPYSISQYDHSSLGIDSASRGYPPPKSSVTTSNFRSLGADNQGNFSPKTSQRMPEPVVITKESRVSRSDPSSSVHKHGSPSPSGDQQFQRDVYDPKANRPSTTSNEKQNAKYIQEPASRPRHRHSSASASKEVLQIESERHSSESTSNLTKLPAHRASETQLSKNRNLSTVSLPQRKEESLAKSASLGANLHEQSRSKPSSPKSNIRHSRSRTSDMKSTPPARRTNVLGQKITNLVGMKSKSNSSNTLESEKAKRSPRCVEVGIHPDLQRDGSKDSASGSFPSVASEGSSSIDKTLQSFIGGLGPGQIVGRQTLATNSLGELELGLYDRNGDLEVQIIRAKSLVAKQNSKVVPATYVKVYLIFDTRVIAKKKTKIARRSLDPVFDQLITFEPSQYGHSLQMIVWGDYGRMDHKAFMGVVQIRLEGLDLSSHVIGWYKLFPSASLADASVLGGHRIGSMTSLEMEASRS